MGIHLIAVWFTDWETWKVIFQVAAGLGFVIFVHELGHFAVAKMCGVKCEKFYLGFDIFGLKLARFQWGETEYGIGILPLGGYVKMLGQDDNPAKAREEMERARLQPGAVLRDAKPDSVGDVPISVETDHPIAYDPRSYMAKSVPQRMAIISAGVIMNIIFAVVFATIAYGMGVRVIPAEVNKVMPGGAAYQADLQPGDKFVEVAGVKNPWFDHLAETVIFSDEAKGVEAVIARNVDGKVQNIPITLYAKGEKGFPPRLGITGPATLTLGDPTDEKSKPVGRYTAAAKAKPAFVSGDTIVAIDGQTVKHPSEVQRILAQNTQKDLTITVDRDGKNVDVVVPPEPIYHLGLVMAIAPIFSVQKDSPAALAGVQAGDELRAVDGEPVGDVFRLADRLGRRAGEEVTLTLARASQGSSERQTIEKTVKLRAPRGVEEPLTYGAPMSIPALGVAIPVLNKVVAVEAGGPADKAKIAVGDEIVQLKLLKPKAKKEAEKSDDSNPEDEMVISSQEVNLGDDKRNWAMLFNSLQNLPPGVIVQLTVKTGDKTRDVELETVPATDWFAPERGLHQLPNTEIFTAESFGEAFQHGLKKTGSSMMMVYRFLKKITTNQISIKLVGGPVMIAQQAGAQAREGWSSFLLFLTVISANLAVMNFLPIPMLDGGHMVFLAIEGIQRKPVSERVVTAFHFVGFLLIVSLMLFVLLLDVGLIPRFDN